MAPNVLQRSQMASEENLFPFHLKPQRGYCVCSTVSMDFVSK
jgi:hypothetical protein